MYRKSNIFPITLFATVFFVARAVLWSNGLAPSQLIVGGHWQHTDLGLLAIDYWKSLWFSHSQPPLWNALIGVIVKIEGPNVESVGDTIHMLFVGLSFLAGLMFRNIFQRQGLGELSATTIAAILSITPSMFYYETYPFYPHFTFFLVTFLVWNLTRLGRTRGAHIGAVLALITLSWIWAIFHPLIITFVAAIIVWGIEHRSKLFKIVLITCVALISSLPTIKNSVVFGVPSASSWVGMNLAQTVTDLTSTEKQFCGMRVAQGRVSDALYQYEDQFPSLVMRSKSTGYDDINMNHIGLIQVANSCLHMSVGKIKSNIRLHVAARVEQIYQTHQMRPYQYFFDPQGWEQFEPLENSRLVQSRFIKNAWVWVYLTLWLFCGWRAARGEDQIIYRALWSLLTYFTLISHFANGGEQVRMRYTIEPIYIYLAFGLISSSITKIWTHR